MKVLDNYTPLIEQKVQSLGFELYGVKLISAPKRPILRIFIDCAGGVSIKDCELASRELSFLFEVEDFPLKSYSLEVSSPGIDWPLRNEKDFKRVVNRDVTVRVHDEEKKNNKITGTVVSCSSDSVKVKTEMGERNIPYSSITTGKVIVKFK